MYIPVGWKIEEGVLAPEVGTLVHVRSWESMESEYGLQPTGAIDSPVYFNRSMRKWCNSTVKVTEWGRRYETRGVSYRLFRVDHNGEWYFTIDMVTSVHAIDRFVSDLRQSKKLTVTAG